MDFIMVLLFLGFIVLAIYSPAIYWSIRAAMSEKQFQTALQELENSKLFEQCRLIITEPLGAGTEPSGTISFSEAIKNQEFANKSISLLLEEIL